MLAVMEQVRRAGDGELCGHVDDVDGQWRALTVFGVEIGRHGSRGDAERHVLTEGLASLAERWSLRHRDADEDEIVCIVEASSTGVTVARGYYSMPGVPTLRITAVQLAAGEWELSRPP